jgi:hypothetical protein
LVAALDPTTKKESSDMDRFINATKLVWLLLMIAMLSLPLFVFSQVLFNAIE